MAKNKIYSKYGLSFVCLLSVIGGGAYATEITNGFSFVIPNIQGTAGCTPTVTKNANNCTVVQPTARANGTGECQATGDPQTICPGAQGDSCSVKSLEANATGTGQKLTMTCGNKDTTIDIPNGNDGTNCNLTLEEDSTTHNISLTKACGNETPTTVQILHEDLVDDAATSAVNKITTEGTFTTPTDVSTAITNATSGFASKTNIPVMDTTTGGMSWVDPTTGNTIHYGQYTFITFGSYNKKINNKWFKCTKWKTDMPTTTLVQQQIENVQCNSGDGWTYGTDCLLDGSITAYASPLPQGLENWNWKYNLCQIIKSGGAITMIEETVADKGYLTSETVPTALGIAGKTIATTDLIPSDSHIKDTIATVGYAMNTDLQTLTQTVNDGLANVYTKTEMNTLLADSSRCSGTVSVRTESVEGGERVAIICTTNN